MKRNDIVITSENVKKGVVCLKAFSLKPQRCLEPLLKPVQKLLF